MNMNSYSCCVSNKNEFEQTNKLSNLLKLVGERNRLGIICMLKQGEHCVCELMERIPASQSLLSHHLKDLRDAKIIIDEKRGMNVFYSLTKEGKHIANLIFQIPQKEMAHI